MHGKVRQQNLILILAAMLLLAACGRDHRMGGQYTNQDHSRNATIRSESERSGGGVSTYGLNRGGEIPPPSSRVIKGKAESKPELGASLAAMDEIRTAQVIRIGDDVYAAIVPDYGSSASAVYDKASHHAVTGEVPAVLKTRIVDRLKAADPQIRKVYVSANPDYVERIGNFTEQLKAGRPVDGFMQDFGPLVNRLFPGE